MLLFSFWGSMILLASFEFRTKIYLINEKKKNVCINFFLNLIIKKFDLKNQQLNYWDIILFYEFYGLTLLMFILTLVSENKIDKEVMKNPV